ncbi:hypothetical protein V1515DRAFT_305095 [Lipomyces mesembrius]
MIWHLFLVSVPRCLAHTGTCTGADVATAAVNRLRQLRPSIVTGYCWSELSIMIRVLLPFGGMYQFYQICSYKQYR